MKYDHMGAHIPLWRSNTISSRCRACNMRRVRTGDAATTGWSRDAGGAKGFRSLADVMDEGDDAAGILVAAEELGYEVFPSLIAMTQPSGIIAREAYDEMVAVLIADLRESDCDAVALVLHGAGVVDGVEDMEGDLARQVREVIGPNKPLVAPFDLHGNVSDNMGELFDVMLPCHLYPHTDSFARGAEAVRLLPSLLDGSLRAVTHVEHIPMLCPGATTDAGFPAAEMNKLCFALEDKHDALEDKHDRVRRLPRLSLHRRLRERYACRLHDKRQRRARSGGCCGGWSLDLGEP